MPPENVPNETSAFTVLSHEGVGEEPPEGAPEGVAEESRAGGAAARHVHVVKPMQHDQPPDPTATNTNTIFDPRFSRALDFKLRRLKDKEILQANLRRPTRYRPKNSSLAASNPNISTRVAAARDTITRSHPRIDIIEPEIDKKVSPKMDKSPSPGRKSRGRVTVSSEGEKPRFMTTVRTGEFLPPPPELATLLGLQALYPASERLYSYASRPLPVHARHRRCLPPPAPQPAPAPLQPTAAGKRARLTHLFSGVRSLVAGVAGMTHLHPDYQHGSMTAQNANMMHDKRIVRGSTFASHPHAAGDGLESAAARAARTRRRALARRAAAARLRPGTPPPAPGRRHHPIQTEYYLEELFDKGVEMEVGVQTDLFLDRPATPIYVPAKTGADAATQIYPGDLFDFDLEVEPILEVLVGKCSEQALAEVAQEEELAALREQQRRYTELRDAERAERARLAAQDLRLTHETERRVAEARLARAAAVDARARAAAATLVQGYVAELLPAVLAGLRDQGYLMHRTHTGVEEEFMPWLVNEVSTEIESIITSRDVITEIVRDVVDARAELYRGAGERDEQHASPEQSVTPPSMDIEEENEVDAD